MVWPFKRRSEAPGAVDQQALMDMLRSQLGTRPDEAGDDAPSPYEAPSETGTLTQAAEAAAQASTPPSGGAPAPADSGGSASGAPPPTPAPAPVQAGPPPPDPRLDRLLDMMGDLESKLESVGKNVGRLEERHGELEDNVGNLVPVFELLNAQDNPFTDLDAEEEAPAGPPPRAAGPGQASQSPALASDGAAMGEGWDQLWAEVEGADSSGAAAAPNTTSAPPQDGSPVPASLPMPSETESFGFAQPPLLYEIHNDTRSMYYVMFWLEFLLNRVLRKHLPKVLDYYERINWVSGRAKLQLLAVVRGELDDPENFAETEAYLAPPELFDEPGDLSVRPVEDWRLSVDEHLVSLSFIEHIAGLETDPNSIEVVTRNIERMMGYGGAAPGEI